MEHFSYSLFLSLMHSFWQAALLVCVYFGTGLFIKRTNPFYKRNFLFILLATQVLLSISTFYIYYTGTTFFFSEYIGSNLSELFIRQPYIESFAPWLIVAYIFVIAFKTAQLIFHWRQFKISSRMAWIKPSIDLRLFTTVKANEFGIRRKVNLWFSNAVNTPLTFGFLKPVILLPVALVNNLSVKETETLILHELTHIKSHDYFFNWILIVCDTFFFFNPFIKIITERIKLEREKNCDSRVLQFNYHALSYAETLLKTARFKATPAAFLLTAVFKNAQLVKRIRFFTEEKNLHFKKKNYTHVAFVPVIAMFVLSIFFVNFIKNKNSIQAVLPQKINTSTAGNYPENINARFSTAISAIDKTDLRLAEENNNDRSLKKKTDTDPLQEFAKVPVAVPMQGLLMNEVIGEDMIVPVSLMQDEGKEIILTEENSATGRSITKVYKMKQENGKWKATLMWTISETRLAADSLPYLRDTTTRFFNPAQAQ